MKQIPYRHRNAARAALIASAGLGPMGAFSAGEDILAVGGIWSLCLMKIAAEEGCSLDKDTALGICKSVALGVSGYWAGCKLATKIFFMIPGAGVFAAMGASSIANVIFTYRFVLTLCKIFERNGGGRSLNFSNIAEQAKTMFGGNGLWNETKDIISIYLGS